MKRRVGTLLVGALASMFVPGVARGQTTASVPVLKTVAGTTGFSDGLPGAQALLYKIVASAADGQGNTFLSVRTGYDNRVVRLDQAGVVTVVAGNGGTDTFPYNGPVEGVPARSVSLPPVTSLATLSDGSLLIGGDKDLFRLSTNGVIAPLYMNPKPSASLACPRAAPIYNSTMCDIESIATDANDNVYVADRYWNRIYKTASDGTTTLVGGGGTDVSDGIPAVNARLTPRRVVIANGVLFFADPFGVRTISATGIYSTVFLASNPPPVSAGMESSERSAYLSAGLPNGDLLFLNATGVVRYRTSAGVFERFVGRPGATADPRLGGMAIDASFDNSFFAPNVVASANQNGAVTVTNAETGEVFRITDSGTTQLLAGKRYALSEPANGVYLGFARHISSTGTGVVVLVEGEFEQRIWRFEGGRFNLVGGSRLPLPWPGSVVDGESAERPLSVSSAVEGCNQDVYLAGATSGRVDSGRIIHRFRADASYSVEVGTGPLELRSVFGGCGGVFATVSNSLVRVNADDTLTKLLTLPTTGYVGGGSDGAGGFFLTFDAGASRFSGGPLSTVNAWGAATPTGWVRFFQQFLTVFDAAGNQTVFQSAYSYLSPWEEYPSDGPVTVGVMYAALFAYNHVPSARVAIIDRLYLRQVSSSGFRDPVSSTAFTSPPPRQAAAGVPAVVASPRRPATGG